jgi:DNA-binding GntR family transcriptional regulator
MADGHEIDLPDIQVRRESTAEQVAGALRGLILAGTVAPGTHLSEGPVSEQLGVSRNTVHEALKILVGQGLVRREMHRGAYVSELGADDVRDLFRVRRLIELAAVRELAGRDVDLGPLEEQLSAISKAATPAEIGGAESRFWTLLVELVQSERFGALHASAISELHLSAGMSAEDGIDPRRIVRRLRSLVNAMRKGDAERAASIASERLDADARRHLALVGG